MSQDARRLASASTAWPVVHTLDVPDVVLGNAPAFVVVLLTRNDRRRFRNDFLSGSDRRPISDSAYKQIAVVAQLVVRSPGYCAENPLPSTKHCLISNGRIASISTPANRLTRGHVLGFRRAATRIDCTAQDPRNGTPAAIVTIRPRQIRMPGCDFEMVRRCEDVKSMMNRSPQPCRTRFGISDRPESSQAIVTEPSKRSRVF